MPTFPIPRDAWQYGLSQIERYGHNVVTEDNALIREFLNLRLEVVNPLQGYPLKDSGWDLPALEKYAQDLCEQSYDLKGFDYNYCERMSRQLYYAKKMLTEHPTTRRATIYLWLPEKDLETSLHKPCQIVANYIIRDNKLYAVHFFRSHDIRDAWPTNVYGLGSLQKIMAEELGREVGSLTTFSVSAHYYVV
jgi:thymidylate synthase (methanogen type)